MSNRNQYQQNSEKQFYNETIQKPAPSSGDAERTIIGGILLDKYLAGQVFRLLTPADFYQSHYRKVMEAILILHKKGQNIDPILIGEEINKTGSVEAIGGVAAITQYTFGLPKFSDLSDYINVVKSHSLARSILQVSQTISGEILTGEKEISKVLVDAIKVLILMQEKSSASQTKTLKEVTRTVRELFIEWQADNATVSRLDTGIPELNAKLKLKGLSKAELALIAARPSLGKTALLLQISMHIATLGIPVLFISLEMLMHKLVMRMLPNLTGIPNKAINPVTLKNMPAESAKLFDALDQIQDRPMYFDRAFELNQITATAEFYIQTKGVQLVVFDYLTLIKDTGSKNAFSRDAEVGYITNEMKELGIRTDTAILGAAQLNRESEKEHRRPRFSDLRESGVIEQACDTMLFPYDPDSRQHALNPDSIKDFVGLELYCAKQRDGERGWSVDIDFDKNAQTFRTLEMYEWYSKQADQQAETMQDDDIKF